VSDHSSRLAERIVALVDAAPTATAEQITALGAVFALADVPVESDAKDVA
jgi:hypothetical protein